MKNNVPLTILLLSIALFQACKPTQHDKSIETVTIKSEINTSAPDHKMCSSLNLTKNDIETYFSIATEVDENEFHREAIILPCKYVGTIKISGELLQWEIYAGGAGYLFNSKSVNKRYLCNKKCCDALKGLC